MTLGNHLRARRLKLGIGLRELAGRVGMSATYLSRVETDDEKNPPAEKLLYALAEQLGFGADDLMALAGRVSADVLDIILGDPGMPAFLRATAARGVTGEELMRRELARIEVLESQHTCEGIVEEHARWVVVDGQAWSLRTESSPAVGACVQVVDLGDDEVTGRWLGYSFPASSDKRGGR